MNIQAVAQRTGVPAATLRKWEQRYSVLKPERTAGSHRRYDENDILRVEWLKARLDEGFRIGEAARLLGTVGGRTPLDLDSLVDEIVSAASATNAERIQGALRQALTLYEPREAIVQVIEPALKRLGECWADGRLSIGQEHLASEIFRARLRSLLDPARPGTRGTAVFCCVPGELHEIGLLCVAVLLQADGWRIVYLGCDTPLSEAAAVAAEVGASLLCVSATAKALATAVDGDLEALATTGGFRVLTGGIAYGAEPATTALAKARRFVRA